MLADQFIPEKSLELFYTPLRDQIFLTYEMSIFMRKSKKYLIPIPHVYHLFHMYDLSNIIKFFVLAFDTIIVNLHTMRERKFLCFFRQRRYCRKNNE